MSAQHINTHYLKPLLKYIEAEGHITAWMKSKIKASHSRIADSTHKKSARAFCFVVLGERIIHYAAALECLPDEFIVGILLHEIAHMIEEEKGGDPELCVDEWVLSNMPEAKYKYKNVTYEEDETKKTARNLECVSQNFLDLIGV